MSYTKYIEFMQNCNYIDPERQNANVMLNGCINETTKDIKYVEPIIKYYDIDNNPIDKKCNEGREGKEEKGIEGYTNGNFYTDNGPGKSYFKVKECPDGFAFCSKTNLCKEICTNCSPETDYKSLFDPCIVGNYNGIDNQGNAYCATNLNDLSIKNPFIF